GSQAIFSADLHVRSQNRSLTIEELAKADEIIGGAAEKAESVRLFSMAAGGQSSRLSQLVGISDNYPLYGDITLEKKGKLSSADRKVVSDEAFAWVYPEILVQLNLKIGDTIKLGEQSFVIDDVVIQESAGTIGAAFNF